MPVAVTTGERIDVVADTTTVEFKYAIARLARFVVVVAAVAEADEVAVVLQIESRYS